MLSALHPADRVGKTTTTSSSSSSKVFFSEQSSQTVLLRTNLVLLSALHTADRVGETKATRPAKVIPNYLRITKKEESRKKLPNRKKQTRSRLPGIAQLRSRPKKTKAVKFLSQTNPQEVNNPLSFRYPANYLRNNGQPL